MTPRHRSIPTTFSELGGQHSLGLLGKGEGGEKRRRRRRRRKGRWRCLAPLPLSLRPGQALRTSRQTSGTARQSHGPGSVTRPGRRGTGAHRRAAAAGSSGVGLQSFSFASLCYHLPESICKHSTEQTARLTQTALRISMYQHFTKRPREKRGLCKYRTNSLTAGVGLGVRWNPDG